MEKKASSEMGEDKQYDVVVFGASGVTGQYVVEELAKVAKTEKLSWAVAGRNPTKLKEVLMKAAKYSDTPEEELAKVPVIVADVGDQESVERMCRAATLVLNCVGPYRFYGEQVVAACIKEKASHLDVSGEPQYLEGMLLKYHTKAKEAGVYVVGACGFDSIPCDLGVTYLKQQFEGDLNSAETFLNFSNEGKKKKQINFGTWQSAIHGIAHHGELGALRKATNAQIFTRPPPKKDPPLKKRSLLFREPKAGDGWFVPFVGSDKTVAVRTQLHRYNEDNERPVQVQCYVKVPSLLLSLALVMMALIFFPLCYFSLGRKLLEKYPEFFSLGFFTRRGPTRDEVSKDTFSMEILGRGWGERLAEPTDSHGGRAPDQKASVRVSGPDPAYVTTSICLVQAGLALLRESHKMPIRGGVYTPGAAFGRTSLVERLTKSGVKFQYSASQ